MYFICYCIQHHTFCSWKFSCVISFWPAIAIYIPASKCPVKSIFCNNISISTHPMAFLKVTCSCCVILYMNKKDGRFSILVSTAQLVQTMYMGKMLTVIIIIIFVSFEKKGKNIPHFEALVVTSNFHSWCKPLAHKEKMCWTYEVVHLAVYSFLVITLQGCHDNWLLTVPTYYTMHKHLHFILHVYLIKNILIWRST